MGRIQILVRCLDGFWIKRPLQLSHLNTSSLMATKLRLGYHRAEAPEDERDYATHWLMTVLLRLHL
jgi:hypothetical protein